MLNLLRCFAFWVVFLSAAPWALAAGGRVEVGGPLRGVNLGAAAFGKTTDKHGFGYLWPTKADVRLYGKEMDVSLFRIPFLWERMQPELFGPLDHAEISRLDDVISAAAAEKRTVILDLHNYGAYRGKMIGSTDVPVQAFADFWARIAKRYADQPFIAYGLMNEPNKHGTTEWAAIAQRALLAIREAGGTQTILVPGTHWSGAHSWLTKKNAPSNAEALATIRDPANNFVFEVHQYFDSDSSGTHRTCVSDDIGVKRLQPFTLWLKETGHRGFLGEFGASNDPICLKALEKTLKHMTDNADVWYGWTYWAAAKWFGTYMFNIYPPDPEKNPQVAILKAAIK